MKNSKKYLFSLVISLVVSDSVAVVVTDGTMGSGSTLSGPNYQIEQSLGMTSGVNLFHSFAQFDLSSFEQASFNGDASIQNVIGRITSGHSSAINGKLAVTIPEANLFLLNPQGFVFGDGFSLDLTGSFYTSTANHLNFVDGRKFYSRPIQDEILSTAAPVSFGFLSADNPNANIQFNGSQIQLSEQKNLVIAAPRVSIEQGGDIYLPSGNIRIETPLNEQAEVALNPVDKSNTQLSGSLQINASNLEVSDTGLADSTSPGYINISTGSFGLSGEGTIISGNSSAENAKPINIKAQSLTVNQQAAIISSAQSYSKGADILLDIRGDAQITGGNPDYISGNAFTSGIFAQSSSNGQGGNVELNSNTLSLNNYSVIDLQSTDNSIGGNLLINVVNDVNLTSGSRLYADALNQSFPGSVRIKANNLSLNDQSTIDVGNFSSINMLTSSNAPISSGTISIELSGDLTLLGASHIYADTMDTGVGGAIIINADNLMLKDASSIDTASKARYDNLTTGKEQYSQQGSAFAGDIDLSIAKSLIMENAEISTRSDWDFSKNNGVSGDAGKIIIDTGTLNLRNASITSAADNSGGGQMLINVAEQLYLVDSKISSSVAKSSGNGGDIQTDVNQQLILNNAHVIAQAYEGNGGNIHLVTPNLVQSTDSLVDASSQFGVDGSVEIDSPNQDYDSNARVFSAQYLDANQWQKQPCYVQMGKTENRFVVTQKKGVAPQSEDLFSADLYDMELEKIVLESPEKFSSQSLAMQQTDARCHWLKLSMN